MSGVFKKLKDETPKTVGQDVGEAISLAMADANAANERMAVMLAKTISEALAKLEAKVPETEKTTIKKWIFQVERNDKGLMTQVIATAE